MTFSDILSYFAMFIGLASSLFFGIGAYNTKANTLVETTVLMWGRGLRSAKGLIEQKYDYITGATLLALSFSSQLVSRLMFDNSWSLKIFDSYTVGLFIVVSTSILTVALVRSVVSRLKAEAIAAHTRKTNKDI